MADFANLGCFRDTGGLATGCRRARMPVDDRSDNGPESMVHAGARARGRRPARVSGQQWRANAALTSAAQAIRSSQNALAALAALLVRAPPVEKSFAAAAPERLLQQQIDAGLWDGLCTASSVEQAFAQLNTARVLCVLHDGPAGQRHANSVIESGLKRRFKWRSSAPHFRGQLLMATSNDYRLGIMNGDVGLCWPDANGVLIVFSEG